MESEGDRFKRARKALGLTLNHVALVTGYSVSTISGVENNLDKPSVRLRKLLVHRLGLNEIWLASGHGEMFLHSTADAWVEAHIDENKIWSPAELEIRNTPEYVDLVNRLRYADRTERAHWLKALNDIV